MVNRNNNLVFLSVSVFLVCELLQINDEKWMYFIVSSLLVLNISYICSFAVYIYTIDIFALALLFALLSVFLFVFYKYSLVSIILSSVSLSISMGLYQSYFAVAVALFVIIFIRHILSDKLEIKDYLVLIVKEIVCVLSSGVLYKTSLDLVQTIMHVDPNFDAYDTFSNIYKLNINSIINFIPDCYSKLFSFFLADKMYESRIFILMNTIILIIGIASYVYCFFCITTTTIRKIFLILSIAFFPMLNFLENVTS